MEISETQNHEVQAPDSKDIWSWKDILWISVFAALILVGGSLLFTYVSTILNNGIFIDSSSLLFNAILTALEAIAILFSVYIFGLRRRHLNWADLGLKPVSLGWLFLAIAIGFAIMPTVGLIALLIQYALGLPVSNPQLGFLIPERLTVPGAILMFLFGGFVVPLAEEIFFRGLLYRWMRQFWNVWPAIIVSSILFGLLHGEISVAGATFILGIILAWLYERSGSLWPSITIHVINNSLKLLILYVLIALGYEFPGI